MLILLKYYCYSHIHVNVWDLPSFPWFSQDTERYYLTLNQERSMVEMREEEIKLSLERGLRDWKTMLYIINGRYIYRVSPPCQSYPEMNKDSNRHAKVGGWRSQGLSSTQGTTGNRRLLRPEEIVFPREEHANRFCNTKWSTQKTHIQVTLPRLSRIYLGIYIYTYV